MCKADTRHWHRASKLPRHAVWGRFQCALYWERLYQDQAGCLGKQSLITECFMLQDHLCHPQHPPSSLLQLLHHTVPIHIHKERTNRALIRGRTFHAWQDFHWILHRLRDLSTHIGIPILPYQPATKPDQSRGFALDRKEQRYFAFLMNLLLLASMKHLRGCYSVAIICPYSADSTICLKSQASTPRNHPSFAKGLS